MQQKAVSGFAGIVLKQNVFLRGSHHSLLASFFGKTSNNGIETGEHPLLSVLSVRGARNIVVYSIRDKEKVKRKKRK